ncbi:MAG: TolC family protein [Ignavibacteria bacterium]|nr:TolC family protein [Ignavibacteria bacterium]
MLKYFVFLLMIVVESNLFAQEVKTLTLDKAIQIALHQNVLIRQSENNLEVNKYQVLSSYGSLLPTLSASGNWSWSRSEQKGGTTSYFGVTIDYPASKTDSREFGLGLNSNWVLFDGLSNFSSIAQSKTNLQSSKYALERLKQDIVFQTQYKYYNVLKALQLMKVQEENLKWNKKSLESIIERNRVGQVTLADVYQQQVNYGNAELQLIQAKNNYEISRNDLLAFLTLDVGQDYEFADESINLNINIDEQIKTDYEAFNELVNKALQNRFDYLSKQLELQSRQYSVTMAKSGHFPRLTGSFGATTNANRYEELFDSRLYRVGLTLNIPIFSGWDVSERVQMAEVGYKNSELQLSDLERTIRVNLKKALLDLEAGKKRLEVDIKNVEAAKENLRINEEKYNLGSGTILNLLLANSQYTLAQSEKVNATFDYLIIKKQMEYYVGVLEYKSFE